MSEEEWNEVLGRLPKGTGGALYLVNRSKPGLETLVTPDLVEAGYVREVRETWDQRPSDVLRADWIVQYEDSSWEGGIPPKVGSAPFLFTLGLLPDIASWEVWDFYRVAKAERPDETVAWIGVPGTRGMVTGLLALFMSALPSWEMQVSGESSIAPIRARHFTLNLAKVLAADASGEALETDPEVLRRLAKLVGSDLDRIPVRVLDEQVEIQERLRREAEAK